jgi:hypothetical protein
MDAGSDPQAAPSGAIAKMLIPMRESEPSAEFSLGETRARDTMAAGVRRREDGQMGIPDSNRLIESEDSF